MVYAALVHIILDMPSSVHENMAAIAQLGERQTEDLQVPGSIPGLGKFNRISTVWASVNARPERTLYLVGGCPEGYELRSQSAVGN